MADPKLFAVYLGGRAPKCNTELHDVVFVVGSAIEATYEQLMDKWFGEVKRLHVDSWIELRIVDGHRVTLRPEPPQPGRQLYFINLGAYTPGEFSELHANTFLVAETAEEAKSRAKSSLLRGTQAIHTDDLFAIEDCIAVAELGGLHVHLTPTDETEPLTPNNGYHIIPRPIVAAYAERKGLPT
jgi:hypothetical protein